MSPELREIYNYRPGMHETIGSFMSIVHPDDRAKVQEDIKKAFATGHSLASFRIVRSDNSVRVISSCATVVYDSENKPLLMTGFSIDVTPIVNAENKN